jgi:hypothetical protein
MAAGIGIASRWAFIPVAILLSFAASPTMRARKVSSTPAGQWPDWQVLPLGSAGGLVK